MAGFAYGFDDGGAIPDDGADNSGALPVASGGNYTGEGFQPPEPTPDDSGALPVVDSDEQQQQQPQQQPDRSGGLDINPTHVPQNARRIIQYLLGGDAAPQAAVAKFEQGVQAEHPDLPPEQAALVAVHKAQQAGGDEAAFAIVQANRVAYNAKQSFAQAALNGSSQGKPPDLQAAAAAATQAATHMLDGSSARFVATDGGVTATVKLPGASNVVSYNLTPQQFGQYVNVGGDGQFDKVLGQGGIPAVLQKIAGGGQGGASGGVNADGRASASSEAPPADQQENRGTQSADAASKPARPSWLREDNTYAGGSAPLTQQELKRLRGYKPLDYDATKDDNASASDRARQMYPHVNARDAAARNQYVQNEQQREESNQNKVDVENVKVGGRVEASKNRLEGDKYKADRQLDAAHARMDAQTKQAADRAAQRAAQMAQSTTDAAMREAGRNARKEIDALIMSGTAAPEKIDAIMQKYSQPGRQAPQAAAPQARAPQAQAPQAQRPANVPQGAKFYNGKWYTRGANGEAVLVQ